MNIHNLEPSDLETLRNELDAKPHRLDEPGEVNEMKGCSPLMAACFNKNNFPLVQLFVERGANVNWKTSGGSTPLMMAAFAGSSKICKYLLQNGADINATNNYQWTPLMFACNRNHIQAAKTLIMEGAELIYSDHEGKYALDFLRDSADRKVLQELYETMEHEIIFK